jgi:sporulation protein YlmC with PRC-barrel domain
MSERSESHPDQPTSFVDHEVTDTSGDTLGRVADVVSDDQTLEPKWLVVESGGLRKHSHFVPAEGSFTDDVGRIVVPYDKASVADTMEAGRDHILMPEEERELGTHYGIE